MHWCHFQWEGAWNCGGSLGLTAVPEVSDLAVFSVEFYTWKKEQF